jgi:hypothetical protein
MPSDDQYINPDVLLSPIVRRAAAGVPSPTADLDAARRGNTTVPIADLSAGDLQVMEMRRELQQARDRMRHLEQALRTAGRVLQPYLGNGR